MNQTSELPSLLRSRSTRNRILAAAAVVFGHRGIAAATVQHVLDEAGVSRRTLYQHFGSKEEILDALFEVATDMLLGQLDVLVAHRGTLRERVVLAVDGYLAAVRDSGPLVTVLTAEAMRPDSQLAPRRKRTMDRMVEVLVGSVPEGERLDPLVVRVALLATEALILHLNEDGMFGEEALKRARQTLLPMAHRLFASEGETVPPLATISGSTRGAKR
jgi:AcrR family transcriptional regulator